MKQHLLKRRFYQIGFIMKTKAVDREGTHGGLLCFHVQYVILTHTSVGGHAPGEGANMSRVLRFPQALQLGKFTGCTDEGAQALRREWRSD